MFDLFKKTYLAGLGLASMTREKMEEVADELVKRGEIAEKDRGRIIEDMMKQMQKEQDKLFKKVREYVKSAIRESDLPTRDEYNGLHMRIIRLETEIKAKKEDDPSI
jgi:polyhydroxyalkanoate synthesis regulator phasin